MGSSNKRLGDKDVRFSADWDFIVACALGSNREWMARRYPPLDGASQYFEGYFEFFVKVLTKWTFEIN